MAYKFNPFSGQLDNTGGEGNFLPITGGTLTGKLTVSNSLSNQSIDITSSGGPSVIQDITDGNGLSVRGRGASNLVGELRIVGNSNGWVDNQHTAYFQADLATAEHNLVFQSGDYGADSSFSRLQFVSNHTQLTDKIYTSTPIPTALFELIGNNAGTVMFKLQPAASQTGDLQQWQNSGGTVISVVNAGGSVGIGTSAPSQKLEVNGGIAQDGGQVLINQANGNQDFKVGGNSIDGMVWVRSGFDRVGFGVSSVDSFFHVGAGAIQLDGTVQGLKIENGDVFVNQLTNGKHFKVNGNGNVGMIWVRGGFDRIGFGINGTSATVDNPFDVNLNAKFRTVIAVGDAGVDTGKIVNIDKTITDTSGDKYGFFSINRANMPSNTAQVIFGGFIQAQTIGTNTLNYTAGLRGAKIFTQHNGGGTVTNGYGAEYQVQNAGTGAITNSVALNVLSNTNTGGGTIVNNTALAIADQTSGAVNYAINTGLGSVSFGDHVYIAAGKKLNVGTTGNASVGTGVLVSGIGTVTTTAVSANSLIFLTDVGTSLLNVGALVLSAINAGTNFVVKSTNVADTSGFNWFIIN